MGADVRRVLIADADSGLRQAVFSALLDAEIFSDCVGTTTEALAKLAEERYGVMVIDVALPVGDAPRVVASVRAMPPEARPVVLVLAANPELARTLDVDIVQIVLRRPIRLRHLVDLIESCLRSAAARPSVPSPPCPDNDGDQAMS